MVGEEQPDLVFTDLGMPRMNGYEFAKAVRSDQRFDDTVLVAVTGESQDTVSQHLDGCRFDHLVTKPVGINRVMELVKSL